MARERSNQRRKLTQTFPGDSTPVRTDLHRQPSEHDSLREQMVRRRAFELFEQRICLGIPGDPDADWLKAEREVDERISSKPELEQQAANKETQE